MQVFTPTPSTYSSLMYYTELDPFTGQPIFVEKDPRRKERQKEIVTTKIQHEGTRKDTKDLKKYLRDLFVSLRGRIVLYGHLLCRDRPRVGIFHRRRTAPAWPRLCLHGGVSPRRGKNAKSLKENKEELRVLPSIAVQTEPGGVTFKGDLEALYRANLHLRTASRILARLGNFFYATTFPEMQKRASRLPWERCLTPGQPVAMRVTCHQSKLYHSDAVARSLSAGLEEGWESPARSSKRTRKPTATRRN